MIGLFNFAFVIFIIVLILMKVFDKKIEEYFEFAEDENQKTKK